MFSHCLLLLLSQFLRFYRVRHMVARRFREDVRANWNIVSIIMWLVYLLVFTHWCALCTRAHRRQRASLMRTTLCESLIARRAPLVCVRACVRARVRACVCVCVSPRGRSCARGLGGGGGAAAAACDVGGARRTRQ